MRKIAVAALAVLFSTFSAAVFASAPPPSPGDTILLQATVCDNRSEVDKLFEAIQVSFDTFVQALAGFGSVRNGEGERACGTIVESVQILSVDELGPGIGPGNVAYKIFAVELTRQNGKAAVAFWVGPKITSA